MKILSPFPSRGKYGVKRQPAGGGRQILLPPSPLLRSSETAAFAECLLNTEGAGLCPSLFLPNGPKFSARCEEGWILSACEGQRIEYSEIDQGWRRSQTGSKEEESELSYYYQFNLYTKIIDILIIIDKKKKRKSQIIGQIEYVIIRRRHFLTEYFFGKKNKKQKTKKERYFSKSIILLKLK